MKKAGWPVLRVVMLGMLSLSFSGCAGCSSTPMTDAGMGDGDGDVSGDGDGDGDAGDGDGDGDTGDGDGDGDTGDGDGDGDGDTGDGDGDGDAGDGDGDGDGDDCDLDLDGYDAESCGGTDCDDNNLAISPVGIEVCSFVDENCNGETNDDLICTFVAHGRDVLYRVDPFVPSVEVIASVTLPGQGGLLDVDIDPDGHLLAVLSDGLYEVQPSGTLTLISNVATPYRTNGMAINQEGTIFITNDDDTDSGAFTVNRATGAVSVLGDLSPYESSGDCVVLKNESLLMTSPHPDDLESQDPAGGDVLVFVDRFTAATTLIGPVGFHDVFGLSASFGFLFGMTDHGELLLIDSVTGAGELLWEDPTLRFWGAANGD